MKYKYKYVIFLKSGREIVLTEYMDSKYATDEYLKKHMNIIKSAILNNRNVILGNSTDCLFLKAGEFSAVHITKYEEHSETNDKSFKNNSLFLTPNIHKEIEDVKIEISEDENDVILEDDPDIITNENMTELKLNDLDIMNDIQESEDIEQKILDLEVLSDSKDPISFDLDLERPVKKSKKKNSIKEEV